ncbi:MAG TPA: tRNA preQ1(34) S-adenosylmethionine ribosyltransferase-isomerase QueA [Actinobacteria bacterium]|nr:tRNA preQ1(34) S-adenosylmethionine ribosyltransferase-isomerase QueA [Actinomycetota bacterium]
MKLRSADFDYTLPVNLIAQTPLAKRSSSKLMVVHRLSGLIEHRMFEDMLNYLESGDCLVVNETKVRPARLRGHKETGAAVELLLLTERGSDTWETLSRPARRLPKGTRIIFDKNLAARVIEVGKAGKRVVKFFSDRPVPEVLEEVGLIALPPYINTELKQPQRYQTVFAKTPGSVAAPTAGLHFSSAFMDRVDDAGISLARITLDIGLDTFRPIQAEQVDAHKMHSERYEISVDAAAKVNGARQTGGRIVAIGTTTVRVLETASHQDGRVRAASGHTDLFIRPGYSFKAVDIMLTNFHLPKSTLLIMVSAFAGRDLVMRAYEKAIRSGYRFYSFGDAMLVVD